MVAPKKRFTYVVVVPRHEFSTDVFGPYRSFKRAEDDARAWGKGFVVPLSNPDEFWDMQKK